MFVMATIYGATGSSPVKIRNLSTSGALIEGGVVPPPASKINLSRGSLTIAGEVVWSSDGRAGLKFGSTASVADWLPNGQTQAPQQRVDAIVEQIKAASEALGPAAVPLPSPVSTLELTRVRKMIESLEESLADDDEVLARHGSKLQALDLAAQIFRKLSAEQLRANGAASV